MDRVLHARQGNPTQANPTLDLATTDLGLGGSISEEVLALRAQVAAEPTPVLISGQGGIGKMAQMNGIPTGAAFEVVVHKGATGFKAIDNPAVAQQEPATALSARISEQAQDSSLLSGIGSVGEMARMAGVPVGSPFVVVTKGGKVGFKAASPVA